MVFFYLYYIPILCYVLQFFFVNHLYILYTIGYLFCFVKHNYKTYQISNGAPPNQPPIPIINPAERASPAPVIIVVSFLFLMLIG